VDGMISMWFLKRLVDGSKSTGLFAYLTSRNQSRSRIELEKARQAAATNLIDHLPNGAVFRESTADGWREIWMPPLHAPPLVVLPADSSHPAQDANMPSEIPAQNPRALSQDNRPHAKGDAPQA
jgi:hypothetical protein